MAPDLFSDAPPQAPASFTEFWALVPAKIGKQAAFKAWTKMRPADRQAAMSAVKPWYDWWRKQNPQASWIHPGTFLNARRWEDEGWQPQGRAGKPDIAAFWADSVKSGGYVSPSTCSQALCREMVARGLVTKEDIYRRGLML